MQGQPPSGPLLDISGLTKTFPGAARTAVDDITLSVSAGEILGLVGLNGAGKTTTIRIAAGLNKPSSGHVTVGGFDIVRDKVEASARVGLVPEFPNFDPGAKALSLLRYFAGYHGFRGQQATDRCSALLKVVGLDKTVELRFRTFSQGMKKRFALAAALTGEPQVLLLDEVLNGLDPQGIALVRQLVMDWRGEGRAILLSSHLLNEVQQVADRVAIVHLGRLVRVLSREELANGRSGVLRISIVDLDSETMGYLATKGTIRRDGSTVWIANPTIEADEINADLIRRGCHVKSLSFESTSLESLFLSLIEEPAPEPASDESNE
ncbi:MAG: ABC transporter ATP-binding protein [Thermoplasmata archaeon]